MPNSVPGQLLAAIKARRFNSVAKLFAPQIDFQAWTNVGHWVAEDAATAARIIEVWFTPGSGSTVLYSNETSGARGAATLEYEIAWKAPPDDQPRILRQVYLMAIRHDKIVSARVYCPGLHAEFPIVDLDKQRRQKGLASAARPPAAKAPAAARAS